MILLASKSPRRQELLRQIGIDYQVINTDIDESVLPNENPHDYVARMAHSKAIAAKLLLGNAQHPILTADTSVIKNDVILGKPEDYTDFCKMMAMLSGSTHQVLSAIAIQYLDQVIVKTSVSSVTFSQLPKTFIEAYWATHEPCDKAGGYAIQGLMARYIQKIEGSYSGIMGLPLFELSEALHEIGYNESSLTFS
ncbi:Maf family protein [Wohlfahrtiimonas larvae]|uniref:dTTP/UTP pyrophosphatase n=1 Tax=Wohlfahrtiimonas larvae TaxID=1157986 RepID=A0ABP9MND1_9GAMM|nr:Maf family protein [Wohlfahrtiimonas larvae]